MEMRNGCSLALHETGNQKINVVRLLTKNCWVFIIFLLKILKKLVPSFFDKERYVIHYENLPLYLRQIFKLKI